MKLSTILFILTLTIGCASEAPLEEETLNNSELTDRIDSLTALVGELHQELDSQGSTLDALEEQVAELESGYDELADTVDGLYPLRARRYEVTADDPVVCTSTHPSPEDYVSTGAYVYDEYNTVFWITTGYHWGWAVQTPSFYSDCSEMTSSNPAIAVIDGEVMVNTSILAPPDEDTASVMIMGMEDMT